MRIPFEDTKVPALRSQDEVKRLLYAIGFTAIAEFSDNTGRKIIRAELGSDGGSAQFQFEANIEIIVPKVRDRFNRQEDWIREQSIRMAWRSIHYQVKALHDSIKLGAIDVAEAFAGNLLLTDKAGQTTKMSDFIKNGMAAGTLTSANMSQQFLLEERK